MIIALVNFPLPASMSFAEYQAKMLATVPRYQGIPGLLRKSYIFDGTRNLGGAVYTFQSREDAEACFSEDFVQRITAAYGKPDIRYFESPILIDNEKKVVMEFART